MFPLSVVPNKGDGPFALWLNHGWTVTAATVSVWLSEMMKKDLDDKPDNVLYHTDATTVLRYISNDQR